LSKVLRIGNLAPSTTAPRLREICTEFGQVSEVKIAESPFSGQSRGFGFVEMSSLAEATACLSGLNEQERDGRKLAVSEGPSGQFKKRAARKAR